jgi:HK97 family phage portal protein
MITWLRKQALNFALAGSGESRIVSALIEQFPGGAVYHDADAESFVRQGYQGHPTVFACVELIASRAASVPWQVCRIVDDEKEVLTTDDLDAARLVEMFEDQPNDRQGISEFIEGVVKDKLITGEYFIELVTPGQGGRATRVVELHQMPAQYVTVNLGYSAAEPVRSYAFDMGVQQVFPPEAVLHGKYYNPNNYWRGQSPMHAAVRAITRGNAYETWNVSLAQNLGKTGGILSFDAEVEITDEDESALRDKWARQNQGPHNAGQPLLMGALKEYIETGMTPADADWLEGARDVREVIASVYSVPGELIGISNATHENRKEAKKALYENAVIPVLDSLQGELNRAVAATYGEDIYIEYDTDAVPALQEDEKERHSRVMDEFDRGLITDREARQQIGYEPDFGDGTRWIPANRIPLSDTDVTAEERDRAELAERRLSDIGLKEYTNGRLN